MDNKKIKEALEHFVAGFKVLSDSVETETKQKVTENKEEIKPLEILAEKVAYAYNTLHPEYGINSQYKNLNDMINTDKIKYVIAWLKKKNSDELEGFFKLNTEQQRSLLKETLEKHQDKIKEIFTKRFAV